jgi:hypothetical protein
MGLMPANTDHLRRDAEHAARLEISINLDKYKRRIYEEAKTHIGRAIAEASDGAELDGTAIGRDAVRTASAAFLGAPASDPQPAIEAGEVGDLH